MRLRQSKRFRLAPFAVAFVLAVVITAPAALLRGQQKVPFNNNIPVAPSGLAKRALPAKPVVYDTAEGQNIRVSVVTSALEFPWSMAFLPDGTLLVTERASRLRVIRNGVLDPKPVAGTPMAYSAGESGLPGAVHGYMDVVIHPRFAEKSSSTSPTRNRWDATRRALAVARGKWDGKGLTETKDVFVSDEPGGSATKLAFGRDNTLFISTASGTPAESSQDPKRLAGKILRLTDEGGIPKDNPYVGKPTVGRPEVNSIGHRNSLGLALHPTTGEMWQNENGPNGGDEINIIRPGKNYGWPIVSLAAPIPGRGSRRSSARTGSRIRSSIGCRRSPSRA